MNLHDLRNEVRASMDAAIAVLASTTPLTVEDRQRISRLGRQLESYPPGAQLDRVGFGEGGARLIASGWACEQRILPDGRRQIFSFLLPGDAFPVSQSASFGIRTITALTRVQLVDATSLLDESERESSAFKALTRAKTLREERLFDHIVRLGRQTAYERIAHLLLELCARLAPIGQESGGRYRIPLTQETLADAMGLSIVHVNRTLQQLRRDKLIELKGGGVTLLQPKALALIAGYESDSADDRGERTWSGQVARPALAV